MRNGNNKKQNIISSKSKGSYPTYEEWKLEHENGSRVKLFSSYPTYEEWKLISIANLMSLTSKFLSYLWGMETFKFFSPFIFGNVLFLSYLWGMETKYRLGSRRYNYYVLILPMRNGNFFLRLYRLFLHLVLILPMRNGNYSKFVKQQQALFQFLSYLWGMETTRPTLIIRFLTKVLILPMRNGNHY